MNPVTAPNPYESPAAPPTSDNRPQRPSQAGGWLFAIGMLVAVLGYYNVGFWSLVQFGANPLMKLPEEVINTGYAIQQIPLAIGMAIQGSLMIYGGRQLAEGGSRTWAMVGAWAAILPPTGMCLLPALIGIWALLSMRRTT